MKRTASIIRGAKGGLAVAAMAALGVLGAMHPAQAQTTWKPATPIKLIVPFPPGGGTDILARLLAPGLTERVGTTIVENRPGATATIGTTSVYQSKPDGTTLLVGSTDGNSIFPHVAKTQYDSTRFVPIAPIATGPLVLLGRPGLPASNLKELMELGNKQEVRYASAGIGGSPHVLFEALARQMKLDKRLHVPYTGQAPAIQALLGDQVDILFIFAGGSLQYQGKLKYLGTASQSRLARLSSVPTLVEQGVSFIGEAWIGIVAPPETPAAIATVLAKAFNEVTASPDYRAKLTELGLYLPAQDQAAFAKHYLDEYQRWGETVRAANIKVE